VHFVIVTSVLCGAFVSIAFVVVSHNFLVISLPFLVVLTVVVYILLVFRKPRSVNSHSVALSRSRSLYALLYFCVLV